MYSIYQFTFDILGTLSGKTDQEVHLHNANLWSQQILDIFNNEIVLPKNIDHLDLYEPQTTLTREWAKYAANLLKVTKPFKLLGLYDITLIKVTHNRFQKCVYLQVYFKGNVLNKDYLSHQIDFDSETMIDINNYRNHLSHVLTNFQDQFSFSYKESKFNHINIESILYDEIIFLINPTQISKQDRNHEDLSAYSLKSKHQHVTSKVHIDFDIRPSRSEKEIKHYERGIKFSYLLLEDDFSDISNHFTSIFILFQRSYEYINEYSKLDLNLKFLLNISQTVSDAWLKGRVYLMSLDDKQRKEFNASYFKIMELNTLMDGEITAIKSESKRIKNKYVVQYDRVMANVNHYNSELDDKHDFLLKLLKWPIQTRDELISNVKDFKEPTDLQVKRLKDMFDSKNTSIMTDTMNKLTVVVAVWGVLTFAYSSIFSNLNISENWLSIGILVLFLTAMVIIFSFYLNINPRNVNKKYNRPCNKYVKDNFLGYEKKFSSTIEAFKSNSSMKNYPEKHLGDLCDFLITMIVFKIYCKGFNYEEFFKALNIE